MSDDLKCPQCEAPVPDTGISSATGIGDSAGNVAMQQSRQHAKCPDCGALLVRNPHSDVGDLQHWRLKEA